jgi:TonB family protein
MPENILVVEYEPRYTDRVKQALFGQPFTPAFARDGEEAIRALDTQQPRLIVLSSVVPKISTADLIRAIRERKPLETTPILLTVSGYEGSSPKQDAQKIGASDILAKPYSETEFLGKIQEMLGDRMPPLTSNDIFGELLEDEKQPTARKPMKPTDDVDKLLDQTLSGIMRRKKDPHAGPTAPGTMPIPKTTIPASESKPKTQSGTAELDKLVQDTLSGLERKPRLKTAPAMTSAVPSAGEGAPPATATPQMTEKVLLSQPLMAPAPVVNEEKEEEEEEPTDGIKYGQYVLLDRIATGGMAEVWKARMRGVEGFQKIVAIKKILPHLSDNQDFIEMFIDEAKLAAQLNHNNIIHIYDLGKTQGTYFIAMEYVEGHDLKTILKRGVDRDQPLGVELSLFIASKVAAALDYAHRRRDFEDKDMSLVHRDVSPQNVLISQEGDIKLCDFGIAKAASKASHTQAGALKGKLQYMSPEQAWGKPIDRRSDIFALATVLFELLSGRKLFTGDNEISILEQVREARVVRPSELNDEVTPEIDAVVLKALNKEPSARYQTAGEMARDIDSILYNMKPTPTSADLAIYMHRIWIEDAPRAAPAAAQTVVDEPVPAPVSAPPPSPPAAAPVRAASATRITASGAVAMPPWEAPRKKKSAALFAIAAVVVVAIGIGGFVMLRGRGGSTTAPAGAPKVQAPVAAAVTTAIAESPSANNPSATQTIVPAPTDTAAVAMRPPAIDQAQVDAEVQKRIAAERAKLDEQARALQAQNPPAPAPTPAPQQRPAPILTSSQPPLQAAPVPAPVTQTIPPPPPPAPDPAPVTASAAETPAPQETASAAPQPVREGDLVPPGTEGLTPAHITRQAAATYPPIARIQRAEGSVVVNVLVSETGQVLDMRIISGVKKSVGLNEAAQQAVRRSVFAPGTKDGVRVKSWTMVRIDFKL